MESHFFRLIFALFLSVMCQPNKVIAAEAEKPNKLTYSKVYWTSYESVWRAAQLSLKYPIAVNNIDNGMLETDWIKAVEGFVPPTASKEPTAGIRYKITINVVKGKVDHKNSVRVTVRKKVERLRDFFSDIEGLETDGLEEKTILYRIERELTIDEAIKKASTIGT